MTSNKLFKLIAAVNGFLAVALGAFGAHGLREILSEHMLGVWQTAVHYHFFHVLALLLVTILHQNNASKLWLKISCWAFTAGIILFSGSLYCLALGGPQWLGPITPLGGACFLAAWFCLAIAALK